MTDDESLLNMMRTVHRLALLAVFSCSIARSAAATLQSDLFGASFTNDYYSPGVQLCDTGAVNGTWGNVPEGAAIAAQDPYLKKKYMALSSDAGLLFTPLTQSGKRTCSDLVSIRPAAYEDMSRIPVPTGARAAFAIYAPENGGKTNYLGWVCSLGCWTNLFPASGTSAVALDEWQEVMVRFLKLNDAHDGYVQYWLRRSDDGSLVPLHTEDGVYWIRTGKDLDTSRLGKIGFFGDGGLERILGQEPKRGLIIGVGTWYDYLFVESVYKHFGNSGWEIKDDPCREARKSIRSYVIDGTDAGRPVTYLPSWAHPKENVEVTELEVQFTGANDDETFPANACARIRMVEMPDETFRFACLADGQWKTNEYWAVSADAKYTVEISLLRMSDDQKFVSYRYKEGYGLEGGAYRDLFLNEPMSPSASGKTLAIDFDGYGIVHEIKGKNNPR